MALRALAGELRLAQRRTGGRLLVQGSLSVRCYATAEQQVWPFKTKEFLLVP